MSSVFLIKKRIIPYKETGCLFYKINGEIDYFLYKSSVSSSSSSILLAAINSYTEIIRINTVAKNAKYINHIYFPFDMC